MTRQMPKIVLSTFLYSIAFNPLSSPGDGHHTCSLYTWAGGTESLSDLPRITQVIRDGVEI